MRPLRVGDRLPPLELLSSGARIVLPGRPRRNLALLLLPRDPGGWEEPVERFRRAAPRLREWYGFPLVVRSGAAGTDEAVDTAADPDGVLERLLGVEPGRAALLVADRWNEVYHLTRAECPEELPGPDEVEEWLKYLATQCPECGVPDEAGYADWG